MDSDINIKGFLNLGDSEYSLGRKLHMLFQGRPQAIEFLEGISAADIHRLYIADIVKMAEWLEDKFPLHLIHPLSDTDSSFGTTPESSPESPPETPPESTSELLTPKQESEDTMLI